ncbi:MAG: hypothetical protein OXR73_19330 [Myxococcales bacterium]|nr:hypothetical protein [Myxococcales bacterium]
MLDGRVIVEIDHDELAELLMELKHDLGKHMLLPVSILPADATDAEVRSALAAALRRTRPGIAGPRSARRVFQDFRQELGGTTFPGLPEIEMALERALVWDGMVDDLSGGPLERARVTADLRAVGEAIGRAVRMLREDCGGPG